MAQAVPSNTLTRVHFSSAGATRHPSETSAVASAYAISAIAWIPVIDHPDRVATYLRSEKFPRKIKSSAALATAHATKVIAWREHFAGFKRRRREATAHPRYFPYLEAAE